MILKLEKDYYTSKKGEDVKVSDALGKKMIVDGVAKQIDKSNKISNEHFYNPVAKAKKQEEANKKASKLKDK